MACVAGEAAGEREQAAADGACGAAGCVPLRLRRGEEVIATGHLGREQPLEVGERIAIGSQAG